MQSLYCVFYWFTQWMINARRCCFGTQRKIVGNLHYGFHLSYNLRFFLILKRNFHSRTPVSKVLSTMAKSTFSCCPLITSRFRRLGDATNQAGWHANLSGTPRTSYGRRTNAVGIHPASRQLTVCQPMFVRCPGGQQQSIIESGNATPGPTVASRQRWRRSLTSVCQIIARWPFHDRVLSLYRVLPGFEMPLQAYDCIVRRMLRGWQFRDHAAAAAAAATAMTTTTWNGSWMLNNETSFRRETKSEKYDDMRRCSRVERTAEVRNIDQSVFFLTMRSNCKILWGWLVSGSPLSSAALRNCLFVCCATADLDHCFGFG